MLPVLALSPPPARRRPRAGRVRGARKQDHAAPGDCIARRPGRGEQREPAPRGRDAPALARRRPPMTARPAGLVVTCAMGRRTYQRPSSRALAKPGRGYDAVLADVPCSRRRHAPQGPRRLEAVAPRAGQLRSDATQVAIARNSAALVRPGGLLLYSTCSLNPLEDEAVVAAVLLGPAHERFELVRDLLGDGTRALKSTGRRRLARRRSRRARDRGGGAGLPFAKRRAVATPGISRRGARSGWASARRLGPAGGRL